MKIDLTPKQSDFLFKAIETAFETAYKNCVNTQVDENKPTIEDLQHQVNGLMTQLAEAEDLKYDWFQSRCYEFCARARRLGIITTNEAKAPWNVTEFADMLLLRLEGETYTPIPF